MKPLTLVLLAATACDPTDPKDSGPVDTGIFDSSEDPDPWSAAIDAFWGEAPDQETRLAMFDDLWEAMAASYASFGASGVDWDWVRETYRPRIQEATSHGRFYQLFSEIFTLLQDGHALFGSTDICDWDVSLHPPVVYLYEDSYFSGACITPLEDDRLLVYAVAEDNPAGLVPGDVILGYDGVPWREQLDSLLEAGTPVCGGHASADISEDRSRMASLLSNTHLFGSLDLLRQGSTAQESVPTSVFEGYGSLLACTDQVEVEGVERPFTSWARADRYLSWGKVEGTNIGYIYVYEWSTDTMDLFTSAVTELFDTDGLIIDQRYNLGGGTGAALPGLALFFCEDAEGMMNCAVRDGASDDTTALDVSPYGWHDIVADTSTCYDRPIAVLTGPSAISAGDLFPYYMTFHPQASRFGRATDGSFGAIQDHWTMDPWTGEYYAFYTYAACVDADLEYLQASEQTPEHEVWLDPDDVALGRDTVVEAALAWIGAGGNG